MSRELDTWRQEQRVNSERLRQALASGNRGDVQTIPLQQKVTELDAQIHDVTEACAALRTKILNNDAHIKTLTLGVAQR
jgi:hypothetical protein